MSFLCLGRVANARISTRRTLAWSSGRRPRLPAALLLLAAILNIAHNYGICTDYCVSLRLLTFCLFFASSSPFSTFCSSFVWKYNTLIRIDLGEHCIVPKSCRRSFSPLPASDSLRPEASNMRIWLPICFIKIHPKMSHLKLVSKLLITG